MIKIAALYVAPNGCYSNHPLIDPWDASRDARKYKGPHRVIAHPPCERWGRYWFGGPSSPIRYEKGDDNGCFKAALKAVRKYGGILEHPEGSAAWEAFGISRPPRDGGWIIADRHGGFTCCVEQGHYGHRARKMTWLYSVGLKTPDLIWGKSHPESSVNSNPQELKPGRRASRTGICQRMSKGQRIATPIPFRELLISLVLTP